MDVPALAGVQVANRIAQRRLAAMAHVQRARGVGRDKFHQNFFAPLGLLAKLVGLAQHFADHFLLGGGFQANVQKAGARNFNGIHPLLKGGRGLQRGLELLAQGARVELERLGQLHGGRAGIVAVGRHFGVFKGGAGARTGGEGF